MKYLMLTATLFSLSVSAFAVDGVILIDQAKALAGNVTPGDQPGFPVTLSKPGSYKLSGNLTLPDVETRGIVSSAGGVTLDLNGFSIIGPAYCPAGQNSSEGACLIGQGHAVMFFDSGNSSSVGNYVVRNGRIFGAGGDGVMIENGLVEDMDVAFVGGAGIDLRKHSGIARNNRIRYSQLSGIFSYATGTVIENNVVEVWNSAVAGKNALVKGNRLTTVSGAALNCSGPMLYGNNFLGFTEAGGVGVNGAGCQDGGGNLISQVQ